MHTTTTVEQSDLFHSPKGWIYQVVVDNVEEIPATTVIVSNPHCSLDTNGKVLLYEHFLQLRANNQYVLPNATAYYSLMCGFGLLDIMAITR